MIGQKMPAAIPLAHHEEHCMPPQSAGKATSRNAESQLAPLEAKSVRAPLAPRDPPRFALTTTKRSAQPAHAIHYRTLVAARGCCRSCPPAPNRRTVWVVGRAGCIPTSLLIMRPWERRCGHRATFTDYRTPTSAALSLRARVAGGRLALGDIRSGAAADEEFRGWIHNWAAAGLLGRWRANQSNEVAFSSHRN
jgi:hypothetical protein